MLRQKAHDVRIREPPLDESFLEECARGALSHSDANDGMTSLPYVLIILFTLSDGSIDVMRTSQSFASPLTCSMQAFLENETAPDRTYVCVTRERALAVAGRGIELSQTRQ